MKKLQTESTYKGLPVYTKRGPLKRNCLKSTYETLQSALAEHPSTMVIRVDLHFPPIPNCPDYPGEYRSNVISRFSDSVASQVEADLDRKRKSMDRVHDCTVRHTWAKERNTAHQDHYHVALFLNGNTYRHLGNFNAIEGNMAARIKKAWGSALGCDPFTLDGLVHFPENAVYRVNVNSPSFKQEKEDVFYRLSYFAKEDTKHYGDRSRSFGCSNK
mgnify:CR=1 FL=1